MTSREAVARRYGEHLTDRDLLALTDDRPDQVPALRRRPELVLDLLDRPAVADAVLSASHDPRERFRYVSPFLVFAAAVHRTANALVGRTSVLDRTGPRVRIPVLDGPVLAAFAADPAHRLFLAELLASYARLTSGVAWRRDERGRPRGRRWDELDLPRLAELLADTPEDARPGVWRRIGDGALFLAGVFPEYAERTYGSTGTRHLGRATGFRLATDGPVSELLEELAHRGPRGPRRAGLPADPRRRPGRRRRLPALRAPPPDPGRRPAPAPRLRDRTRPVKGGLLPLLVVVAVPAFAVGTLLGAGPAAVVGAFVALFGLITSLGGPLWPDLRRLAVLAPVLFGAAVGPRLLADVSRPAAFALIVVIVTAGALVPLRGSRYSTTALGLGMVTLFAYGIPLLSPASSWQFVLAAAAGVVVALVLRLAFGVADPSKPTRAAVADLLDGDGDVSGSVSLWHADGRRRWLGTVLQEAGRFRLARRSAEALARRSDDDPDPALDDLRTRAHEVADRVRAKRGEAPGTTRPDVGKDPVAAAHAALDAIDRAAAERDDGPVSIPPEARRDLRSVPLTGWLRTAQVRHALRTGLGVLAALLLSMRLRPGDPLLPTLLMTTFGVLQASWRDTLGKAWPRVVGLASGSAVVLVVILLVPTAAYAPIAGVALVVGLSTITTRPALGSAAMVCMSVAMNSSLRHLDPVGTLVEYVLLTAGALVIAVVVGFAVVPGVRPPALRVRVEEAESATVAAVRSLGGPQGEVVAAQRAARRATADLTPDHDRLTTEQQADLDRFREGLVDLRTLATASVLDPDDEHPAVGRSLAVLEGTAEPGPDDGVLVALAGEVRTVRDRLV